MIMVFGGNRGERCNIRGDRGSEGLASVGTDPLRMAAGRVKIHRVGGPLRGFVQQALKLARRDARRDGAAMSRLSFFDFARSLTLSRYAAVRTTQP